MVDCVVRLSMLGIARVSGLSACIREIHTAGRLSLRIYNTEVLLSSALAA